MAISLAWPLLIETQVVDFAWWFLELVAGVVHFWYFELHLSRKHGVPTLHWATWRIPFLLIDTSSVHALPHLDASIGVWGRLEVVELLIILQFLWIWFHIEQIFYWLEDPAPYRHRLHLRILILQFIRLLRIYKWLVAALIWLKVVEVLEGVVVHVASGVDVAFVGVVPIITTDISIVAWAHHVLRYLYLGGALLVVVEHVIRTCIDPRCIIWLTPLEAGITCIEDFIMVPLWLRWPFGRLKPWVIIKSPFIEFI